VGFTQLGIVECADRDHHNAGEVAMLPFSRHDPNRYRLAIRARRCALGIEQSNEG
jgi:hypothetical protein